MTFLKPNDDLLCQFPHVFAFRSIPIFENFNQGFIIRIIEGHAESVEESREINEAFTLSIDTIRHILKLSLGGVHFK